jgi:hypothetical protein
MVRHSTNRQATDEELVDDGKLGDYAEEWEDMEEVDEI